MTTLTRLKFLLEWDLNCIIAVRVRVTVPVTLPSTDSAYIVWWQVTVRKT